MGIVQHASSKSREERGGVHTRCSFDLLTLLARCTLSSHTHHIDLPQRSLARVAAKVYSLSAAFKDTPKRATDVCIVVQSLKA